MPDPVCELSDRDTEAAFARVLDAEARARSAIGAARAEAAAIAEARAPPAHDAPDADAIARLEAALEQRAVAVTGAGDQQRVPAQRRLTGVRRPRGRFVDARVPASAQHGIRADGPRYAAYALAVPARVLACEVGEDGLADTDRRHLAFGQASEDELVHREARRTLDESMAVGWRLLAALPRSELTRLPDAQIERLSAEYRRSVRRARALQEVLRPEVEDEIAGIETRLEELEREDALAMRRGARVQAA
jgi:hypothetical protein